VQEAHEEIGIHAIVMSNVVIIGVPYANRPSEKVASERILSLTEYGSVVDHDQRHYSLFGGQITPRLVYCTEPFADKGEDQDFRAEDCEMNVNR